MADSKITALTALTAADPINDMLPIVDVSDTTMAASGTTKKISVNNILSSSPTASGALTVTGLVTAGSATITGDLTVDTNVLKVDTTLNRVGIGTASPSVQLHLAGTDTTNVLFAGVTKGIRFVQSASTSLITGVDNTGAASYQPLSIGGSALDFSLSGTTAMTLNSTGLGIGVTPVTSHILSCAGPVAISGTNSGTRTSYIANASACSIYYTDGGGSGYFTDFGNLIIQPRTSAPRSVIIATGSTTPVERAVVKSTGQVRFVPLAADPAGAESGDVYYNSSSNKLKCYNGTTWNDLF